MEVLFEILFQFFGELLINLIVQALGVVGEHTLQPYRSAKPRSPTASIISHVLVGAALGALTLIFWRHSMMTTELGRVATLVLSPLVAGAISAGIGVLLLRSGKDTVPLERFGYAYVFAFSLSAVRFLGTL